MILQALNEYYDRKATDPQGGLAPEGFEFKTIPFVLVLDEQGHLVLLADRREGTGKKKEAKAILVPQGVKRASGVAANLLWDTVEYVLGVDTRGKPERVAEQHAAFLARLREAFGETPADAGLRAVLTFLTKQREQALDILKADPVWPEVIEANAVVTFQLNTDIMPVCQRPAVIAALRSGPATAPDGRCLVSGEDDVIERLHPAIKGVWGAQTSGANIVSFNLGAFNSYGKTQSYNAPVGRRAVFAYTTALNHLLTKGSRQRVQVGDASTVFWAEKANGEPFEAVFLDFLDPPKDDPDRGTGIVASVYRSVMAGKPITEDDSQRFHVLGLAPNAARIAVRFWHVATVAELGQVFRRYFGEIDIARPAYDSGHLSLFRLLASTALQGKAENIPPNLGGEVMRAILEGRDYPEPLMQSAMRRIRAEREVTHPRAALLKAYLNRNHHDQEITVSLNPANTDPGYRLGCLFAALERVQEQAQGNLNASIRDRYYGAFSTTPVTVLPLLMKLKNHHLAKIDSPPLRGYLEKTLSEIVQGLDDIPSRLSLVEQARFAVGYYHQRQFFFTNRAADQSSTDKE